MSNYPFRETEKKWQHLWEETSAFHLKPGEKPAKKSYVLEMFPYPSGRIHMGHVRNYAIGDVIARFMMAQGYSVLHPMGWDAFGLPAENAAAEHKTSPATWTYENIKAMKQELKALGFSFDWKREFATCHPGYYKHEQKIFLDFYKKGLVDRKESWVNWDPIEGSVLANEQVINGRGWRSGALVEKRKLTQWSLKITNYAEELLQDLSKLTGWPEKVVRMQENWIGKSRGALVRFELEGRSESLEVFTTRPETLFGASFCGIAPTHPLSEVLAAQNPQIAAFVEECQKTPTTEEALSTAEKKGIDTGLRVKHPFQSEHTLPVYIANFVLMDYGTGAIFACPAHDERDYDFAQKYGLPILPVIEPLNGESYPQDTAYTGPGHLINSEFLNGLSLEEGQSLAIQTLVNQGNGESRTTYRLRDWCVSRQRYWGCPIPVIHCESCGVVPVPESDLPVKLPEDVVFGQGGNPIENHPTWKHTTCPTCAGNAVRETDTFDTFFESSWYFLRFCNPWSESPIDQDDCNHMMPVDWYIGGIEHAVLHLLYSRFFTKALRDCGYLNFDEPFKNLMTQGMVCHQTFKDSDGHWLLPTDVQKDRSGNYVTTVGAKPVRVGRSEKMSKSKKNVVDPEVIINSFGADAARLFVLSDTPPERDFEWSAEGVEGSWRYLNRVWRLVSDIIDRENSPGEDGENLALRKKTHQTLTRFTGAFEKNGFNKAIAFLRELTRDIEEALSQNKVGRAVLMESAEILILGLGPIVPHLCSELWERLGHTESLHTVSWPKADLALAAVEEVTIAVQVNGKTRGSFMSPVDTDKAFLEEAALAIPTVQRDIDGRPLKRVIIVPNRIVNIVV